jgi:hypothetical protein
MLKYDSETGKLVSRYKEILSLLYPLGCHQLCMARAPEGSLNFQPIGGRHFSLKSLNSYFSL